MTTHTQTREDNRNTSTNRMQRPTTMTDQDWEDFEYWLGEARLSRALYESYLMEVDSTLEREWDGTNHANTYYPDTRQLVAAVGEHAQWKWKRSIAVPLADEVLSRYLNPLQASLYAEEFAVRLVAFHDEAPNGILNDYLSTDQLADKALTWDRFQEATKAFMFDKLFGGAS